MAEITEIRACFEKQVKAAFENPRMSPFANKDWQKGIELLFELTDSLTNSINFMNALAEVLINKPTDYNALVSFVNYLENYLTLIGDLTGKTAALDKSDKSVTLMPLINEFTESLFQQGKINLFLDGLNEVSKFNDRRNAVTMATREKTSRWLIP